MSPVATSAALGAACLLAAGLGLWVRPRLAEHHLDEETRGAIGNITGLIAAMAALLLGLLVASAHGAYRTVSDEVDQLAANMVDMDRSLRAFGEEGAAVRDLLRRAATAEVDRIWPPDGSTPRPGSLEMTAADEARQRLGAMIRALPAPDETLREMRRHLIETMAANARIRVLLLNQVDNELPLPIVLVVGFWLTTLFLAFGLLARRNVVVLIALAIGATSVGGAMFLLLELNRPFGGIMEVSGDSPREALLLMAR
jgi:hypothetical protein